MLDDPRGEPSSEAIVGVETVVGVQSLECGEDACSPALQIVDREERAQQLPRARLGRIDVPNEQLWQDEQGIPLTAKAFAVLRYLAEHTGQLVTKAELFDTLWPGTAVSDGALTFCIVELRKALGDNASKSCANARCNDQTMEMRFPGKGK